MASWEQRCPLLGLAPRRSPLPVYECGEGRVDVTRVGCVIVGNGSAAASRSEHLLREYEMLKAGLSQEQLNATEQASGSGSTAAGSSVRADAIELELTQLKSEVTQLKSELKVERGNLEFAQVIICASCAWSNAPVHVICCFITRCLGHIVSCSVREFMPMIFRFSLTI